MQLKINSRQLCQVGPRGIAEASETAFGPRLFSTRNVLKLYKCYTYIYIYTFMIKTIV